ncbi:ABC transporter ATP-binding protein [Shinella sp.]|uniref:ABC transporter ATP-binding protein n=2 Tax=Shinella sp. TaxID=1870904 RepID=UPI0040352D31
MIMSNGFKAKRSDAQHGVRFRGIFKRFGEGPQALTVINNLNLDIGRGEFFSLLGPSGCGKTTALRMIGGFEHPSEGELLLDGEDITGVPPYRRDVNMVFQSYSLFPHMDVYDNIEYGLRRKGIQREERRKRIAEVVGLAQLEAYLGRRPTQLSGGQQQRVALARALVNRPKVLLLDEPLAALDAKLRSSMQTELRRIQQEVGITFVFVTHDQQEAFALSDRVAVMRAGRLEQVGTPHELYSRPATRFVADFVGQSNFIDGRVEPEAPGVLRAKGGEVIPLPAPAEAGPRTIVVRPENVALYPAKPAQLPADVALLRGTVLENTFLGSKHLLRVKTSLPEPLLVEASHEAVNAVSGGAVAEVWLSWRAADSAILAD